MSGKITEEQLAEIVVEYLKDMKWDVYSEVIYEKGRADMVAVQGAVTMIVEVKNSFSSAVVEQAFNALPYANYVYVAVPQGKTRVYGQHNKAIKGRYIMQRFCQDYGIGIFEVDFETPYRKVREEWKAKLRRNIDSIRQILNEKQKTHGKAGNAKSEYWTPWKDSCERWVEYVAKNEGCTVQQLVENVGHHYYADASAKSNLATHIKNGVIKEIEIIDMWARPMRLRVRKTEGE